ncbi:hypothetical protein A6M21_00770 [Desulfotomaculum copahuensis]|uniref:Transglycosylase SLT domain-containing protein n=2 Tax=Desulfotomaculum copahuensis TaxID=1838280 RepID=A0A1B7LCN7_9FIRM|nr:hypothetical protein A6M21_00770 [Desulfotomaculum copahuensis]
MLDDMNADGTEAPGPSGGRPAGLPAAGPSLLTAALLASLAGGGPSGLLAWLFPLFGRPDAFVRGMPARAEAAGNGGPVPAAGPGSPPAGIVSGQQPPVQLDGLFNDAAARYGLDPALLKAVARVESGWNPAAFSPAGAQGLMQLMPATAAALGVDNPWDPRQNLEGGARYLRNLLDRYHGRTDLALAAYNAGPGAVDRYGGIPPYRETQQYVRRVAGAQREFMV